MFGKEQRSGYDVVKREKGRKLKNLVQEFLSIGFPSQFRTYVIQISEWSFNFATKLIAC